jgi:YVTN family beta-propeller protein
MRISTLARQGLVLILSLLVFSIQIILPCAALAQSAPGGNTSSPVAPAQVATTSATASSNTRSALNLDLSSSQATVAARNTTPVIIQVGGAVRNGSINGSLTQLINPGQLLTPAQFLAVNEVLRGGQTLLLNNLGQATGGYANVSAAHVQQLGSIAVPQNVALNAIGFNAGTPLNVSGNVNVLGAIHTLQTAANTGSVLNVGNLNIGSGGLLSGNLPAGLNLGSSIFPSASMTVNVENHLTNMGTIASPGNLTVVAGGSITNQTVSNAPATMAAQNINLSAGSGQIFNSGLIQALGNINLNTGNSQADLNITAPGGTFEAIAGNINLRCASYVGSNNIHLDGGDYLSQNLNLYSGTGSITAGVNNVSGILSTYAGAVHESSNAKLLSLGKICVSGDPTYYNTGSIQITGDISVAEDLAIIAGGDITSTSGLTSITARDGTGQGHHITLVSGANVSPACGSCSTNAASGSESSIAVTIEPASPNGGNIDFSSSPDLVISSSSNTGNLTGGNVTLAAFASGSTGGKIVLPSGSAINSSGIGSGNNGNVTLIAGAGSGDSIATGRIIADGGSGSAAGTGQVTITAAQPTTSDGLPITFDTDGKISSANTLVASPLLEHGAITIGSSIAGTEAGHVMINTAGSLTINDYVSTGRFDSTANTVAFNNSVTANTGIFVNASGDITAAPMHVTATVPVGYAPWGVAVNPAGTFAYVSNDNTVSVIDTSTNAVVAVVPVRLARGVAVNPAGTFVYVASPNYAWIPVHHEVKVIDTSTNAVVATVTVGSGPDCVAVNPAGTFAYVSNSNSGSVSVIDTSTNTVVATVPVGVNPSGLAINPAGTLVYVALSGQYSNQVSVIDTSSNTVVATVTVGNRPTFVAVNPSGTFAYVTNQASETVSVINTSTNTVVATVPVGSNPYGIAVNPAGTSAYVAISGNNTVSIIDTGNNTIVGNVPVGASPFGVAVAPSGTFTYVTNEAGASVSKIALDAAVLISAGTLSLTSTSGSIGSSIPLLVNSPALVFNAAGCVSVADSATTANIAGPSRAGSSFNFAAANLSGNLTASASGTITADSIALSSNRGFSFLADLFGSSSVSLSAGTNINNSDFPSASSLTSNTVLLSAGGAIGNAGALRTAARTLQASAGNDISISNSGTVSFTASSSSGQVLLSNKGSVTIQSNGPFNNSALSTYTVNTVIDGNGNGQILIGSNVNATTVNLSSTSQSTGAGGIQNTGAGGTLSASTVNLKDTGTSSAANAQNIGASGTRIVTLSDVLTAETSGSLRGDINLSNTGTVSLTARSTKGLVGVMNAGNVVLQDNGSLTNSASIQFGVSTTANGSGDGLILIGANVSAPTIILNSTSSGTGGGGIQNTGSGGLLYGSSQVTLLDSGTSTAIGARDIGNSSSAIATRTSILQTNSSGNQWLSNTGYVRLSAYTEGSSVSVTNTGTIVLNGNSAVDSFTVSTLPDAAGSGKILIVGGLGAHTINLTSTSSGSGSGGIQDGGDSAHPGTLHASVVNLKDTGARWGDIGGFTVIIENGVTGTLTAQTRGSINLTTQGKLNFTANSATGSIWVTNDGCMTIQNNGALTNSALYTYFVKNRTDAPGPGHGDILIASDITADSIYIDSEGCGNDGNILNAGAGGLLTASSIYLTINGNWSNGFTGSIGSSSSPISTRAATLSAWTSANGFSGSNANIWLSNSGSVALTANAANGSVSVTNTGSLTLQTNGFANIATGTFAVNNIADSSGNGKIIIGGSVNAATINLSSTSSGAGAGGIQNSDPGGTLKAAQINLKDSGTSPADGARDIGKLDSPITSQTGALTAQAGGEICLSNSGSVQLSANSYSASVLVSNKGHVNIQSNELLSVTNHASSTYAVTTTADSGGNGDIYIKDTVSADIINLSSTSSGQGQGGVKSRSYSWPECMLNANVVNLKDTGTSSATKAQDIGEWSPRISIAPGTSGTLTLTAQANGVIWLYTQGRLLLTASSTAGSVHVDANDPEDATIQDNGQLTNSAYDVFELNSNYNYPHYPGLGNLLIAGNVSARTIKLVVGGCGNYASIFNAGSGGVLSANTVTLSLNNNSDNHLSGNIGSQDAPIITRASQLLEASTRNYLPPVGDIWLSNTGAVALNASGGNVNVTNKGNVTLLNYDLQNDAAGIFSLSTTADAGGNGRILIGADISAVTINLTSTSSGSGEGGIQQTDTGGILSANTLRLIDSGSSTFAAARDIGSSSTPIATQVSRLIAQTGGSIYVTNTEDMTIEASGFNIAVNSGNSIVIDKSVSAAGSLTMIMPLLNLLAGANIVGNSISLSGTATSDLTIGNSGTISATTGNIVAASAAGFGLNISGGGSMSVTDVGAIDLSATTSGSSANTLHFTGGQTFTGITLLSASGINQKVEIDSHAVVTGNDALTINTNLINNQGTLTGNPLIMNAGGAGTIANSSGNIDLKNYLTGGSLTFNGRSLAIIASGSIVNTGKAAATINLSASTANPNGGSLTLIAGYNFLPDTVGPTKLPPVPDQFDSFSSVAGSAGNISLGNVSIITSSTASSRFSGSVLAVATGSITLGSITTTANAQNGIGGTITAIGKGISVGAINTTASTPGRVSISSAVPQMIGTPAIANGLLSGGAFSANRAAMGGNITVKSINTGSGDISIATGGAGLISQTAGTTISSSGILSLSAGSKSFNMTVAAANLRLNTQGADATITDTVLANLKTSTVGGNLTITGKSGIVVSGQTITAYKNLTLANTGASATVSLSGDSDGNPAVLSAGLLTASGQSKLATVPLVGLLKADVQTPGGITIKSAGVSADNGIFFGTNVSLASNGGDISLSTSKAGAGITAMDRLSLFANGGDIKVSNTSGVTYLGIDSGLSMVLTARTLDSTRGGNISLQGSDGVRIGGGAAINALADLSVFSQNGAISIAAGTGGVINVSRKTTIHSKGDLNIGANTIVFSISALKVEVIGDSSSIVLGNNVSITSGLLGWNPGSLTVSTNGRGGFTTGSAVQLIAESGPLSISSSAQDATFTLGRGALLTADGGKLSLSAKGAVTVGGGSISANPAGAAHGSITIDSNNGMSIADNTEITSAGSITLSNKGSNTSTLLLGSSVTLNSVDGVTLSNSNTASSIVINDGTTMTASAGPISISAAGSNSGMAISFGKATNLTSGGSSGIKIASASSTARVEIADSYNFTTSNGGPITINSNAAGANALNIGVAAGGEPLSSMTSSGAIKLSAAGDLLLGIGSLRANGGAFSAASKSGQTTLSTTLINASAAASVSGATVIFANGAGLAAGTTGTVTGDTAIAIGTGSTLQGRSGLTIKTTSTTGTPTLTIAPSVTLTAGALAANAPAAGILNPNYISSYGSLVLSSGIVKINGNNDTPGNTDTFISNGRDLTVTATSGDLTIKSGNTFQANGGNIQLLAKGILNGGKQNNFYARAVITSPTSSAGGGIELGSGLTSSSNINTAFGGVPNTNPPAGALGVGVVYTGNSYGVIQANLSNGGVINLNSGGSTASNLTLTRGVQVFDAVGAGSSVKSDNNTFTSEALKPIAMVSAFIPDDLSISRQSQNGSDLSLSDGLSTEPVRIYAGNRTRLRRTPAGDLRLCSGEVFFNVLATVRLTAGPLDVTALRGALVSVYTGDDCTYVRSCSGSGSISTTVNGKTFVLNAGEELLVTSHKPLASQMYPSDGLARRNTHTVACGARYVTLSDFSIISMVSNHEKLSRLHNSLSSEDKRMLAKLLKCAASVEVVLGHRGAYNSSKAVCATPANQ